MPKKTIALLFYCFLTAFGADLKAQGDIYWNSDFEKEVFSKLETISSDALVWLLLTSKDATIEATQASIEQAAAQLKPRLEKLKTWEKQREFIQSSLKENYFKYQRRNASFQELLEKGYYNCVTGTAFYHLILKELGIESEMVCLPEHVFLKLMVDGEAEYWEAAKIVDGLFEPNEFSRNGITNFLVKDGFVSKKNWQIPKGFLVDDLYVERKQDLRELGGLQYKLRGIENIENEDLLSGYWQFRKSYLLAPLQTTRNLCAIIGLGAVSQLPRATFLNMEILLYVYENEDVGLDSTRISHVINSEIDTLLGTTDKFENLVTLRQLFQTFPASHSFRSGPDIRMLERRIHYECTPPTLECYEMAKQLYHLIPEYQIAQQALIYLFSETLYEIKDPEIVVDSLENFRIRYPFTRNNPKTYRVVLQAMLLGATNRYVEEYLSAGDRLVARFEASYDVQPSDSLEEEIGYAYSEGMKAYFRKADYKNARRMLEKGLQLAPNNLLLLETRKRFGQELGMKW